MTRPSRRRVALSAAVAGFLAFWVLGTVVTIAATGERGADDVDALTTRARAALAEGDGARLHELVLDAPDRGFTDDYAERLRAAGEPVLTRTRPDTVEVRSGPLLVTLSVTEENGRFYLSLLPAGE